MKLIYFVAVMTASVMFGELETQAQNRVQNPLRNLDHQKLCSFSTAEKGAPFELESDGRKKTVYLNKNIDPMDGDAASYWRVENDHIVDALMTYYGVQLSYSELRYGNAVNLLADKLAPCHTLDQSGSTRDETHKKRCTADNIRLADSVRFKDSMQFARMRRAIIKLFNAAETGAINDFFVLRKNWQETTYILPCGDSHICNAMIYNPRKNEELNDILIGRFVAGLNSPFEVYCAAGSGATPTATSPQALIDENGVSKAENAIHVSTPIDDIAEGLIQIGSKQEPKFLTTKSHKAVSNLILVASSDDFAKVKPDGASVKLVANDQTNQDTVTADAALGYRTQWTNKSSDGDRQTTYTLTPFIGIDQSASDFTRFATAANDPNDTRVDKIAYAELLAGIRLDFEELGAKQYFLKDFRRRVSYAGTRRPGWRLSGVFERFTDNYNQQHGERWGGEVSLPDVFGLPGYRRRVELSAVDSGWASDKEIRKPKRLGLSHWATGWSANWDLEFAIDRLDYLSAPLNFDTPDPADLRNVDEFSVYGVNASIDFGKQNMFGLAGDKGWINLSADYIYREGYEGTAFDSTQMWELEAAFVHPTYSKLSFGIEYEFGRDFKTLDESDVISLEFKAQY